MLLSALLFIVDVVPCSITVTVKKEGWGGGGTRTLSFSPGDADFPMLKPAGKTLNISIGQGLPKDTSESVLTIRITYHLFMYFIKAKARSKNKFRILKPMLCSV